jgi:multiple antibiotic resistance protein
VHEFFVTFIALFVAVDIVGVLPVYLGFVAALDVETRQRVALEATITAAGIGVGFLLLGDAVLRVVGVGVGDFQMAGGLLLLILAIHDLLHPERPLRQPGGHLGVVPLGTPLIVGPAVLATLLTLAARVTR